MNITVIGTGYVGLVTGACFAEMGNSVICVDIDQKKIDGLNNGVLPIYEPGLADLVNENRKQGRLSFQTSIAEAMKTSDIFFIAVGTPPGEDGSADLQYVLNVASEIGKNLERYCVVINKSTVPVGTADKVRSAIQLQMDHRVKDLEFDVVSNPEFLKEGAAVADFMSPDRIVVGADGLRSREILTELYAPFTRNHPRVIFMDVRDAEMTKYAANAMLATKISFMNEIANLCELLDVDVENVRLGIGADQRIGFHFIYPGAGYGGSCFPKDVKALINMADGAGLDPILLKAVESRNEKQKTRLFSKIMKQFNSKIEGRKFGIWGLSFKPGTDDMREAPSKVLINSLIEAGAFVRAYDPVASDAARLEFPNSYFESGKLSLADSQYEAIFDADALVLVTEWKSFRNPDFKMVKRLLASPVIVDGRNQYDPRLLSSLGITYLGVGRQA